MKNLTALEVFNSIQNLRHGGLVNDYKPVIVFGPTPGAITEVTVGAGGNLTLVYRPLTSKEMGGPSRKERRAHANHVVTAVLGCGSVSTVVSFPTPTTKPKRSQ
jgi:hypothetical protein